MNPTCLSPAVGPALLVRAGFEPDAAARRYCHPETGIEARFEGEHWLVLTAARAAVDGAPAGLWKRMEPEFAAPAAGWRCDLPLGVAEADPDEGEDSWRADLLEWALATFRGPVVSLDRALSFGEPVVPESGALTVDGRGVLRQIEWDAGAEGKAASRLGCEIVRLPASGTLPDVRLRFLHHAARHAHRAFRLAQVRVRTGADGAPESIRVDVDWTGAPPAAAGALLSAALPALRLTVRWLAPLAVALADPALELRALDLAPSSLPR